MQRKLQIAKCYKIKMSRANYCSCEIYLLGTSAVYMEKTLSHIYIIILKLTYEYYIFGMYNILITTFGAAENILNEIFYAWEMNRN